MVVSGSNTLKTTMQTTMGQTTMKTTLLDSVIFMVVFNFALNAKWSERDWKEMETMVRQFYLVVSSVDIFILLFLQLIINLEDRIKGTSDSD